MTLKSLQAQNPKSTNKEEAQADAASYAPTDRYVDGVLLGCWSDGFQHAIDRHPVILAAAAAQEAYRNLREKSP